jgi:hypothetical protein
MSLSLSSSCMRALVFTWVVVLGLASCRSRTAYDDARLIVGGPAPAAAFRRSIHHSEVVISPLVVNGDCYERFEIRVPKEVSVIKVPAGTTVHVSEGETIVGHVKKSLMWAGHPAEKGMTIEEERVLMGVAMRSTATMGVGRILHLTNFGAWNSFEGGSSVSLVLEVPGDVLVRQVKGMADNFISGKMVQEGWYVIPCQPALKRDHERLAKPR